ncbi:slyX protein [Sinisalibacter lacisalsi]|uniref:SlyX protein n=2 Tax=Sinisalibacter lacisalsi TaxID=1526570 RepID=A0ABQ1QHS6_9RHOB|nr:slyX protein [Sinisalibacter lacisalsi]
MTDRVTLLEESVAHLSRTVEELSDVIARQDGEIAALRRRLSLVVEREAERQAEQGTEIPLADQRPPHW